LEHEVIFVKRLLMLLLLAAFSQAWAENILPTELAQAVQSAINTHPEVLVADSQRLSAKSQVKAGEYRWYPRAEVAVRTGERGDRYSTIGLNQTLWDNGKLNADFDAAKAGESAALASEYEVMQSIGISAAGAYLDVARAREQKAVAEENVKQHQILHESVIKRNSAALVASLTLP
jgi:adhesin transport system outer membrane protein